MKTWSIGKKLGVTTCATGLVIVVLAGLSFWSIRALQAVIDDAYDVDVRKAIAAGRVDEEAHAMVGHEEAAVSSALQQNAPTSPPTSASSTRLRGGCRQPSRNSTHSRRTTPSTRRSRRFAHWSAHGYASTWT